MKHDRDFNFAAAMAELEKINEWFRGADIDLDEGLEKIRRGKELIRQCRSRLSDIENRFTEITADTPEEIASGPGDLPF